MITTSVPGTVVGHNVTTCMNCIKLLFADCMCNATSVQEEGRRSAIQTLSKDVFSRLVLELMETLCGKASAHGTYMSDNLKSGFKATGICPFNPDRVLKKLLQESTNADNDPPSLVSETVVELLKNMRYGSDEQTRRNQSKLNVAPGKSISL